MNIDEYVSQEIERLPHKNFSFLLERYHSGMWSAHWFDESNGDDHVSASNCATAEAALAALHNAVDDLLGGGAK